MELTKAYSLTKANWESKRLTLSKSDIAFIAGKDTFKGKISGFLTSGYWHRGKLIRNGELLVGYAFKSLVRNLEDAKEDFPTWVIFSPSTAVNENPAVLEDVAKKLVELKDQDKKAISKEHHKLWTVLGSDYATCNYLEIPEDISGDALIYLSIIPVRGRQNPFFKLGPNFILGSRGLSKEVLYLPDMYMPKEVADEYQKGNLTIGGKI